MDATKVTMWALALEIISRSIRVRILSNSIDEKRTKWSVKRKYSYLQLASSYNISLNFIKILK